MLLKVVIAVVAVLVLFLGYVSTREGKFRYEKSGLIAATPEKIFPYISQLKKGGEWSPFEKVDPNMKKTFTGEDGTAGAKLEFAGNSEAGSGVIELLKVVPNELVELNLTMTAPIKAENLIEYRLTPEGDKTRFSWTMSGDGGFFGKLINIFIDCEKMVTDQFVKGIENLKVVVEGHAADGKINLNENPDIVDWSETHYVYVEKVGPILQNAKDAWQEIGKAYPEISKESKIIGMMSLYKVKPEMVYRAGAKLESEPKTLPAGVTYLKFEGGKYAKFVLSGSYSQLPEASGRVQALIVEKNMQLRDGFFIENYLNDPTTTPEDQLVTEILVPIQ